MATRSTLRPAALQAHRYGATVRESLCALLVAGTCAIGSPALAAGSEAKDFEILFSGDAHIQSFTYAHPGPDNWIDTVIALESRILRYKSTFLFLQFEDETDMGKGEKYGIFDPNRGRWMFALGSRTEFASHFFEVWLRHDCYHGIDRFLPGQDFKGTSEGVGFGSLGYLQKYRFKAHDSTSGLSFPLKLNYYVNPMAYAPHGDPWQRHPYRLRVAADLRLDVLSWNWFGVGLESLNDFYYASSNEVQRSHLLKLDATVYGTSAALVAFAAWWPYDDQVFRNRDGKVVFGLELNL
jgi:hypothetical protein